MTIKSKTFYMSENDIEILKDSKLVGGLFTFYGTNRIFKNEITLSWKEERKAEATESQIDEIIKEWRDPKCRDYDFLVFIKERIFKGIK